MMAAAASIAEVTARIERRSARTRQRYLARMDRGGGVRVELPCANLAHASAACSAHQKSHMNGDGENIAIVSAYNDILSAHQPLGEYPAVIKDTLEQCGATAQFAGGVPAMCDGVTQGRPGMELSLFSRDVIAMSTAVALSHDVFDGVLCLGVCDKIVPGLLIGALAFGYLPCVLVAAGPMPTGLSNEEKAEARAAYAEGRIDRGRMLATEGRAYHAPGTCTFYGTANTNQMLMELMGLQLPGSAFENPTSALRGAFTRAAARTCLEAARAGRRLCDVVDARSLVNGLVGVLATGGSTNHTLHVPAIARAAGYDVRWEDIAALSEAVPLIARIYPNGVADVNAFHAAGGLAAVVAELLEAGVLHEDVETIAGRGLERYARVASADDAVVTWSRRGEIADKSIIATVDEPFARAGGIRLVTGNLGRAIVKVSALEAHDHAIRATGRVFDGQDALISAFEADALAGDFVAVVRFQGPRANGMPELHKLMPILTVLRRRGQRVALVTDGRMSGASGRVLAALHVTPEAIGDGALARLRDGDEIVIDSGAGRLDVLVADDELAARAPATAAAANVGYGRELFAMFRAGVTPADQGASVLGAADA